jgi:hypothetical protein
MQEWLWWAHTLSNRNFTERRRRMPLSLHGPPEGRCFQAANRRRMPGACGAGGNPRSGRSHGKARRGDLVDADSSELERR